ncbi:MAG: hypothetical protein WCC98_05770 [Candidatus Acidiferrales bacterium]
MRQNRETDSDLETEFLPVRILSLIALKKPKKYWVSQNRSFITPGRGRAQPENENKCRVFTLPRGDCQAKTGRFRDFFSVDWGNKLYDSGGGSMHHSTAPVRKIFPAVELFRDSCGVNEAVVSTKELCCCSTGILYQVLGRSSATAGQVQGVIKGHSIWIG